MKLIKHLTATLFVVALLYPALFPQGASAQNGTLTPYSSYGYGVLRDNATSAQRQMGGVGYAMKNGRQVNVMNPASYAGMDSLTFLFDMGIDMTNLWQEEAIDGKKKHSSTFGGGLDYITAQFPVSKRIGMSVGVLPFSSVGYSFGSSVDRGSVDHKGDGSWNKLYLGLAYMPFEGFSVGANVSYLFGKIWSDSYTTPITGTTTLFERVLNARDWHLDLGAMYNFYVNPDNRVTLGFTWSPKKDIHGRLISYYYIADDTNDSNRPEEQENVPLKGYSMPNSFGAGISYEWQKRLTVEFDFSYQEWGKAKYSSALQLPGEQGTSLKNRSRYALGASFTPAVRGNYLKRIQYRAGGFYTDDYVVVRGNSVREYGAGIGFGFPIPNFKSIISLGVEWRHRQANPNPLLKEDYLNITLGVNFNELWFRKSKIY